MGQGTDMWPYSRGLEFGTDLRGVSMMGPKAGGNRTRRFLNSCPMERKPGGQRLGHQGECTRCKGMNATMMGYTVNLAGLILSDKSLQQVCAEFCILGQLWCIDLS